MSDILPNLDQLADGANRLSLVFEGNQPVFEFNGFKYDSLADVLNSGFERGEIRRLIEDEIRASVPLPTSLPDCDFSGESNDFTIDKGAEVADADDEVSLQEMDVLVARLREKIQALMALLSELEGGEEDYDDEEGEYD